MQDFKKLEVWHLSRLLVVAIYKATRSFPPDERFLLTSQIRRSASSIGANIAEAFGRATRADCARVLQHSVSEGNETYHHLITAFDLGYLTQEEYENLNGLLEPVRTKVFNLLMKIRRR